MIELSELHDAAQKAFPADKLVPNREEAWKLISEMGWLMIDLPEELGGLALGCEAVAAIHFELGRVLSSAPLMPALLGLQAVATSVSLAGRQGWVDRICAGEYVPLHMLTANVEAGTGGTFSGTVSGVFDADMASHVLVSLPGSYILIPVDAPKTRLIERTVWDKSRRLFDLVLEGYNPDPALLVAEGEAATVLHDSLSRNAQISLAADSLGGATAALEATVDYLKLRRQFDRPLAMFQALKHRCADQKIAIAATEALLWARARNPSTSLAEAGAMNARAREVYAGMVEEMIQLHGGIGLTEEHPCHLFMKRAMLNMHLCGSPDQWHEHAGWEAISRMD